MTPIGYLHEDPYCVACNAPGLLKKREPCRYFQAGNCRRGSGCPFAHVPVESPTTPRPAYLSRQHMYTYYPLRTPVYRPQAHPLFLWQPYAPFSPSFDPQYGPVCQKECLSDHPDDKSDPSSADSSSTATSIDYQLRMALDTASLEGADYLGTTRGVAIPPGDLGPNLSPTYAAYSHPIPPGAQAERMAGADHPTSGQYLGQDSVVALSSPLLLPWQGDPRKKPLAYKTKPCRFHAANGKCTSGEKCTFIHEPESKSNTKKLSPRLVPPTDAQLPPKPRDKYEDSRSRDYYPITWRVIGGGVMMGGQRQICPAFSAGHCKLGDDCKLAHETDLGTDRTCWDVVDGRDLTSLALEVGFVEPKSEPGDASPSKGTPPKRVRPGWPRKPTKVPTLDTPEIVPCTPPRPRRPALARIDTSRKKGEEVAISSAPASPVHRRTQSMSMVVGSPPPLETTHSNYAAEL